ncbi:MAG: class I SAM-dependent methyltransferase [Lysobacterales bacterium CG02_land_8_20_14_3_00_62_12]|nr:MAG: class I SAM-dependent methyltransferase [Xanthomonadales bacterium CG02_land_8_20_14_3_00_62_12]
MFKNRSMEIAADADDGTAVALPEAPRLGWLAALRAAAAATPDGLPLPDYLVKHYWWAYLWRPAVWFFDHQVIINAIVFGQYRKLTNETLRLLQPHSAGSTLLIASAYGNMITKLAGALAGKPLTVCDVAPIQLEHVHAKLVAAGLDQRVQLDLMNAESLDYGRDQFDTAFMFLLLHELPPAPRRRALDEMLRVLKPGGSLVLAEYGADAHRHWFHRVRLLRWIFGSAEPFLPSLWKEDIDALVAASAAVHGKHVVAQEKVSIFRGFYRVWRYRVAQA